MQLMTIMHVNIIAKDAHSQICHCNPTTADVFTCRTKPKLFRNQQYIFVLLYDQQKMCRLCFINSVLLQTTIDFNVWEVLQSTIFAQ